jgi:outer membrane protein assembly factor BamB
VQSGLPETPGGLKAAEGTERGAVTVSWVGAKWAESYNVWRGESADAGAMTLVATNVTGTTSFADRSAQFDKTYFYRVGAKNALGASPLSDATDGRQLTRLWLSDFAAGLFGTPTLGDDGFLRVTVFRATNSLLGVNLDGTIRWQAPLGFLVSSPVLSSNGTAYVGTATGQVAAVDNAGQVLWQRSISSTPSVRLVRFGALAVTGDGNILACTDDGRLSCLDPSGVLLWSVAAGCHATSAPVITPDGGIFLSSAQPAGLIMLERNGVLRWSLWAPTPARTAIAPDGSLLAFGQGQLLSLTTSGATNWLTRLGPNYLAVGSPVVAADGTIYVASPGSHLAAVNPDGSVRWTIMDYRVTGQPVLLNDGTLLAGHFPFVAAYNLEGTFLWQWYAFTLPPYPDALTWPAIAPDGRVFCDGTLLAFKGTSGLPATGWPLARLDNRQSANLSGPAPRPQTLSGPGASPGTWVGQVRLTWATNADLAFVEVWRGTNSDLAAAVAIGETAPGTFHFDDRGVVTGQPFYYWLRARNAAGTSDWAGPVIGRSNPDVERLWEFRASTNLSFAALGKQGQVHVATADGAILGIGPGGIRLWSSSELLPPINNLAVAPDGTVLAENGAFLLALNPDGSIKWKRALAGGSTTPLAVGNNGAELATQLLDAGDIGPFALGPDGSTYAPCQFHQLVALSASGAVQYQFGAYTSTLLEPVLGPDGSAVISAGDGKTYVLNSRGEPQWNFLSPRAAVVVEASGGLLITHSFQRYSKPTSNPDLPANALVFLSPAGQLAWMLDLDTDAPTSPWLNDQGSLCISAGARLLMIQTNLRPASSGWAMSRANPQRSGRAQTSLSILGLSPAEKDSWELQFIGVADTGYSIEQSLNLRDWSVVTQVQGTGDVCRAQLTPSLDQTACFYRVRQL